MDAIELLTEDHRRAEQLFEEIGSAGRTKELVNRLLSELSVHAELEEWTLYAEARRAMPEGEELVRRALDEHQRMKDLIVILASMSGEEADVPEKLEELRQAVREHVDEEEREFFPAVIRGLGRPRLAELGETMRTAKEKPGTELHGQLEQAKNPLGTIAAKSPEALDRKRPAARPSTRRAVPRERGSGRG
jgi:hemerythrin-like domain-containing protein